MQRRHSSTRWRPKRTRGCRLSQWGTPRRCENLWLFGSIRAMANSQYLQRQLGSVVNAYQLQNWTPLAPGAYQFAAANWQVSQTVQDQMVDLEKQRQTLEQKRT